MLAILSLIGYAGVLMLCTLVLSHIYIIMIIGTRNEVSLIRYMLVTNHIILKNSNFTDF